MDEGHHLAISEGGAISRSR